MIEDKPKRMEERKFKRIPLRFGLETPEFQAVGIQVSSRGLFISTNRHVYAPGNKLVIEIETAIGFYTVQGIVRHAKKALPQLIHHERAGMGVEFLTAPQELRDYLASL